MRDNKPYVNLPRRSLTLRTPVVLHRALLHFEPAPWSRRVREPCVGSEQHHIEELSEGDVGGVVDGDVLPEFPAASQQWPMWSSVQRQFDEIGQGEPGSARIEMPRQHLAANDGGGLEVDELGSDEGLSAQA